MASATSASTAWNADDEWDAPGPPDAAASGTRRGSTTPALDAMEQQLPLQGFADGSSSGGSGGESDSGQADRRQQYARYPPPQPHTHGRQTLPHISDYLDTYAVEDDDRSPPDATTALLGGPSGANTRRGRKGRLFGRWTFGGATLAPRLDTLAAVLLATVTVYGVTVPWVLLLLLFAPFVVLIAALSRGPSAPPLPLLSNGTHSFHPTTLVVSLDGFRPAYLTTHAAQLPHITQLRTDAVSAAMQPVFPSLTFPNHWSILTGLYPSAHGIVANRFHRPGEGDFDYARPESSWAGTWWGGEPLWSVAERTGRRALNFMWPGPQTTVDGISPSFFVPFANIDPPTKLHKLLSYFDLPPAAAPSLLFMYLPDVDQAGHAAGPDGAKVTTALERVDSFVGDLRAEIRKRHLEDIVDLIVLSDHGMAALSEQCIVFLDDILGDLLDDIAYFDGWPTFGVWFKDDVDWAPHARKLADAADNSTFSVYKTAETPAGWHLREGDGRLAPLWLVPDLGWLLTTRKEYSRGMTVWGAHGYDNALPEMQAIFFTDGPAARKMKAHAAAGTGAGAGAWKSASPAVMETFPNLEIFGLVSRLQDMADYAPPTNGTTGFWDAYLGDSNKA